MKSLVLLAIMSSRECARAQPEGKKDGKNQEQPARVTIFTLR